jgi:hypothetical protein
MKNLIKIKLISLVVLALISISLLPLGLYLLISSRYYIGVLLFLIYYVFLSIITKKEISQIDTIEIKIG